MAQKQEFFASMNFPELMANSQFSADVAALESKFKVLKKTEFRGETTLVRRARRRSRTSARHCEGRARLQLTCSISAAWIISAKTRASRSSTSSTNSTRGDSLRLKIAVSEDELEVADRHRHLAHGRLARARSLRHVRHPFPRPSRPAPHPHVGRLPVLPAAQGFPARRPPQRHARRRLHQRRAPGGRTLRDRPQTRTTKDREPRSRQID